MNRRSAMVFLGMSTLSGSLVVGSSIEGCQPTAGGTTTAAGGGGGGSPTSTSTGTTSSGHTGSGGGPSSTGAGGSVPAVVVTIQQITDATATGHVGAKTAVEVDGVVVMSHKFLVSASKTTGSCLWGVFVSAPGLTETGPNTGLLIASYGTPAMIMDGGTKAYCPVLGQAPAGDAIPDNVKIGDVVNVTGKTDYYLPKTCGMVPTDASVAQYQISNVTKVTSAGSPVTPPPAHKLTDAQVAQLASGTDKAFHDQWGGVRVRIQNVTSVPQMGADAGADAGGTITDQYGHIVLAGSGLQVGDKIYYQGLLKALGDICHSGPVYANDMTHFTEIDGFSYLDFCTWGVLPNSRCSDLAPPPDDCTGKTCP